LSERLRALSWNVSMATANLIAEELIQERQLIAKRQGVRVVQRIVSKECF